MLVLCGGRAGGAGMDEEERVDRSERAVGLAGRKSSRSISPREDVAARLGKDDVVLLGRDLIHDLGVPGSLGHAQARDVVVPRVVPAVSRQALDDREDDLHVCTTRWPRAGSGPPFARAWSRSRRAQRW